jgi:hypothetical protein
MNKFYEFFVAGVKFHQLKECISELKVGDHLSLILEPTNKFDPNAVRIEYYSSEQDKTFMLGYVPAKMSASVSAAFMINTLSCEVIELNPDEKPWMQLKVAIKEVSNG